jgi:PAS domain-containing protein
VSLLGIDPARLGMRHFTDFVTPGAVDDALSLFSVLSAGRDLEATIVLRPTSGDLIAVDLHASTEQGGLVAYLRLADDIELDPASPRVPMPSVSTRPARDAAFRGYVDQALRNMAEPTPDGLTLRLRRLYPHSSVAVETGAWIASRDGGEGDPLPEGWWLDEALPRVRYDAQALILEVNGPATQLFGREMVGHYWQEFITATSNEQTRTMLELIAKAGHAISRFRSPDATGRLIEYDTWTSVDGETFTTVMRQVRPIPE